MNTNNTHPPTKPTRPAKVAVTLPTGSYPAKGKGPAKTGTPSHTGFRIGEASIATVQDFVGIAVLMLPAELRAALGDKDLLSNALELETQEILVIVREADVVTYVHLPILVKELEYPATTLSDGVVLKDITGSLAKQATKNKDATVGKKAPKPAKPTVPTKPVKPKSKGGRHA